MIDILVTNDDGVFAPGILALAQAMRAFGTVAVVAPATNQSASGHKRTVFQDIAVDEVTLADDSKAWAVAGSPADCVALAALGVIEWPPRMVVSGINRGQNMGQDITYSGTVTAAFEAAIHGLPALAVSLVDHSAARVEDYQPAAQIAARVVASMLEHVLPPLTILNLNVPAQPPIRGLRLTRQGISVYQDDVEHAGNIYRVIWPPQTGIPGGITDEGTDLWAVHNGYASLTPLHLDMTAHPFLSNLASWDITIQPSPPAPTVLDSVPIPESEE